ncbi:MAG: KpsF/GutQ family sugar-phosphate isomerase [Desulfobacterales bacterium]|nr:KpsF/GutQ family sugar-phosphate isomerase [Desulfobacterales bacterium]
MESILESAKKTFNVESKAIAGLSEKLTNDFIKVVDLINSKRESHVILTGMGKSGLIGKKIASTMSSTGTPSFFLHPAEAIHGDVGMLTCHDVVIAISYSGETEELIRLIPIIKKMNTKLIAITGNSESTLAKEADYFLNAGVDNEACPLQLAPTSSTTAALAMGDALSIALMEMKNFTPTDFAYRHPGGSLGRRLITKVKDVMHSENLPVLSKDSGVKEVISSLSKSKMGITVITEDEKIIGAVTDGDICRAFDKYNGNFLSLTAESIMTDNPKTIGQDELIIDAEEIMQLNEIVSIIVEEKDSKKLAGIIQRHEI